MAYGLKYSQYLEKGGATLQIRVYVDGWSGASYGMAHLTGASLQIIGGQADILAPVIKTMFSFSLADCWDEGVTKADGTTCVNAANEKCGRWEEFYTPDATKFRVELWAKTTPSATAARIWQGYVTPDSWSENMIYRGTVTITARDMLGALQDKEFDLTGRVSVLDIVQGALSACHASMPLSYTAGHFLVNEDGSSILSHTVAASTFAGDTWQTVLEDTLESLGLALRYNGNNALVLTSLRYIAADTLSGSHTIEYINRSGLRELDPALKFITETFDVDVVELSNPDPSASQYAATGNNLTQKIVAHLSGGGTQTSTNYIPGYTLTESGGEGWSGTLAVPALGTIVDGAPDRGIYFPTDIQETVAATLHLPRMRGYFAFKIDQDGGLLEIGSRTGVGTVIRPCTSGHSISEVRVRVEAVVSGTTKYLSSDGIWVTTSTDFGVEIGQEVIVPDPGAVGIKIVVAKVITENTMPAYYSIIAALKVTVSPGAEGASIISEYKTTTRYNDENNVTITRRPVIGSASLDGCVDFFQNVLALGDAVAADRWNWPGASSYYPLAVMIQAQALCYHAAAASVFTGTAHDKAADLALPGCGYGYYDRACIPVSATFDFASGFIVQTNLREYYTWESVWGNFSPDYSEASGSGRGSTSATGASGASINPGSGSSGGGGGNGTNYWEIGGLDTLLQPKNAYDYVNLKDGLFFSGATLTGTPVPDLYVDVVNNQRVLRSPLALITGGDQIVIDGTPGGGGGGSATLAGLDDVSLSGTPTQGQYLAVGSNGKWTNVPAPSGGGSVNSIVVGTTPYSPVDGVVTLPAYAPYNSAGYLPLSAGSTKALTGALYVSAGSVYNLYLNNTGSGATSSGIRFQIAGSTIGELYTRTSDNELCWAGGNNGAKVIYHSGNFVAGTDYLPMTGGTISGTSNVNFAVNNSGTGTSSYINFQVGNSNKASVGYDGSAGAFLQNRAVTNTPYVNIASDGVFKYKNTNVFYHDGNLTKAVITGLLGNEYHPYGGGQTVALVASSLTAYSGVTAYNAAKTYRLNINFPTTGDALTVGRFYNVTEDGQTVGDLNIQSGLIYCVGASRVGINTSTPSSSYKLDVNGNVGVTGSLTMTGNALISNSSAVERKYHITNSVSTVSFGQTAAGHAYIHNSAAYNISLYTNATERLRIDGTGNTTVMNKLYIGGTSGACLELVTPSGGTPYLKLNMALLTEGDQIVGDGTPGGGGGGGASYLYELNDVADNLQSPATGTMISWYNGSWIGSSYSSIGDGHLLTWDNTNKRWTNVARSSVGVTTAATSQALGLVKSATTGTTANRTYNVEVNADGTMKVNVPWDNSTYSLLTSSADGLAPAFSTANKTASASTNSYYFLGWTGSTMKWYSLPPNAFNDTTYSAATQSAAGLMSSTDKTKLDGIATGATAVTDSTVSGWGYLKTDENVKQTATTTSAAYEILFSATADNTTRTEGARKTSTLTYNPSTKALSTGGAVNGLTLTAATTGFTIAGGTTSKTLTVSNTYTLGDACAKGYTDSSSASAISTGTSLVTERDVYYGLPTINNAHNYTSSTTIYAPTSGGAANKVLVGNGTTSAPVWTSAALGADNKPIYLNSSGVLTEGVACLKLTGGTISGTSNVNLTINNSGTGTSSYINFQVGASNKARTGFDGSAGAFLQNVAVTNTPYVNIASDGVFKYKNTNVFYHDGNCNNSSTPWECSSLTTSSHIYMPNNTYIGMKDTGGTNRIALYYTVNNALYVGRGPAEAGHDVYVCGNNLYLTYGTSRTTGVVLNSSGNVGIGLGTSSPAYKLDLLSNTMRFRYAYLYHSGNAENVGYIGCGSSSALMQIALTSSYSLEISLGGTKSTWTSSGLSINGSLTTTGDQVVSSDATLKTNWRELSYGVADIAKCTAGVFDWKDGRGTSIGTKAQDWSALLPELVHGEEGAMTFAYGQAALVNTIVEAREIERLKARVEELERQLKMRS